MLNLSKGPARLVATLTKDDRESTHMKLNVELKGKIGIQVIEGIVCDVL